MNRVLALVESIEEGVHKGLISRKFLATVAAVVLFTVGASDAALAALAYVGVEGAADFRSR